MGGEGVDDLLVGLRRALRAHPVILAHPRGRRGQRPPSRPSARAASAPHPLPSLLDQAQQLEPGQRCADSAGRSRSRPRGGPGRCPSGAARHRAHADPLVRADRARPGGRSPPLRRPSGQQVQQLGGFGDEHRAAFADQAVAAGAGRGGDRRAPLRPVGRADRRAAPWTAPRSARPPRRPPPRGTGRRSAGCGPGTSTVWGRCPSGPR